MDRIKSGIPGLDNALEGGFPHPSTILLTGESGTGKSVFGLQYLYNGVQEHDENGILLILQRYNTDVEWYSDVFGLNMGKLQDEGKLVLTNYKVSNFEKFEVNSVKRELTKKLSRVIKSTGAKRVVIDSITPFGYSIPQKSDYRLFLHSLSSSLKEQGCTTIMVSEKTEKSSITPFEVEQYLADGVIEISKTREGAGGRGRGRNLKIHKMLATRVPLDDLAINLSEDGLKLSQVYYE